MIIDDKEVTRIKNRVRYLEELYGGACRMIVTANAQRGATVDALKDLTAWFKPVPGAMTASELLMDGCPNDLQASIDKARALIALEG